jgi:hypothetical protein
MLASIASTKATGDQLWLKVIGPAASGKSTLCEAVNVCKEYIFSKSTLRGFHSGYSTDGGGADEDNSLLCKINGKTLVTKDGDTLLQSPNLGQILSEGRDVYDGCSRSHYRNKMSKDYEDLRITWILCGTSSLRAIDSSELGERFLDAVIMEGIDDDLEDEVLVMAVEKATKELSIEAGDAGTAMYEPTLCEAMQLTGGYVKYLRENAGDKLPTIVLPEEAKRKCARLGKFVAHMRARPSIRQEETAEREFGTRLAKQITRMSICLALVLNKTKVDEEVMARVRKVAMDTSRGQTMAIVSYLNDHAEGLASAVIALYTNNTEEKAKVLLRFLRNIKVVELFQPEPVHGIKQQKKWRLTSRMFRLYKEVMDISR